GAACLHRDTRPPRPVIAQATRDVRCRHLRHVERMRCMRRGHSLTVAIALVSSLACGMASPEAASDPEVTLPQVPVTEPQRRPDVIFVPTREAVVEAMLDVAKVGAQDIVYDLGCGDGRIVIAAAKRG